MYSLILMSKSITTKNELLRGKDIPGELGYSSTARDLM